MNLRTQIVTGSPYRMRRARPLVEAVQRDWHAHSGESVSQMVEQLGTAIHFKMVRWFAEISKDGTRRTVSLAWVSKPGDTEDDTVSISWNHAYPVNAYTHYM
jgi:hypothetical protein